MIFFAKPILAMTFGAFLICAETCRHFDGILALPGNWASLPIHDWVAGAFLVYGGVRSRRDWSKGHVFQVAGWAFCASLFVGAFFTYLEDWSAAIPSEDVISERAMLIVIGALLAVSLCGLVSTIARVPRYEGGHCK